MTTSSVARSEPRLAELTGTRAAAWYARYLDDALEPRAPERLRGGELDLLGAAAERQQARPEIQRGIGEAATVEAEWARPRAAEEGPDAPSPTRWALPPSRAVDVTHERLALVALWSSTPRWARLVAMARGRDNEPAAALWELLGTVLQPTRLWYLHTRPSGAASARQLLERSMDGLPVEDVRTRWELRERPGRAHHDGGDDPADHSIPEARLVAALLACAQHTRVAAQPGGLARLLGLVLRLRRPELARDPLPHADDELMSSLSRGLRLWDAVCAALELPLARSLRRRLADLPAAQRDALWGRAPAAEPLPLALLQRALDAAVAWRDEELRPRAARVLRLGEPLERFLVRGQSLRTVGRQLTTDEGRQVDAAVSALEEALPTLVRALQAGWREAP